jgi:hypothetical protein
MASYVTWHILTLITIIIIIIIIIFKVDHTWPAAIQNFNF